MSQTVVAPLVNLNGTARSELIEQYMGAFHALDAAIAAMMKTAPHGRDYQLSPEMDYKLAVAQYRSRMNTLSDMRKDLHSILEQIEA